MREVATIEVHPHLQLLLTCLRLIRLSSIYRMVSSQRHHRYPTITRPHHRTTPFPTMELQTGTPEALPLTLPMADLAHSPITTLTLLPRLIQGMGCLILHLRMGLRHHHHMAGRRPLMAIL